MSMLQGSKNSNFLLSANSAAPLECTLGVMPLERADNDHCCQKWTAANPYMQETRHILLDRQTKECPQTLANLSSYS